jgi:hypothetical protein
MARPSAHILVLDGRGAGRVLNFSEPIRIGSSSECELVLPELAPLHATIEHTEAGTGYLFRTEHEDVFIKGAPALEIELPTHAMLAIGPIGMIFTTNGGTYVSKPTILRAHSQPFSPLSAVHFLNKLTRPRSGAAVVGLSDEHVLVVGGEPPMRGEPFASLELLAISTRTSTEVPLLVGRRSPTATRLLDGRVLIAGGGTNTVEIFDPTSRTSSPAAAMQTTRTAARAFALPDGLVVVIGGLFDPGGVIAEVYDPAHDRWGGLRAPELGFATTAQLDATRFLIAATSRTQRPASTYYLFDSSNWRFEPLPPPPIPRSSQQLVELGNGRVLIAGGHAAEHVRAVEIFDLAARQFHRVADMLSHRGSPAIAALPNGHVLVVGGDSLDAGLYSAEVFDQASNQWYALPPVWHGISPLGAVARSDHSAVIVGIGNVSLAGDAPWSGS